MFRSRETRGNVLNRNRICNNRNPLISFAGIVFSWPVDYDAVNALSPAGCVLVWGKVSV